MGDIVRAPCVSLAERVERIKRLYEAGVLCVRQGTEHWINVGIELIEAKKDVRYGEWIPWIEANLPFSPRFAQMCMRVSCHSESIRGNAKDLSHLALESALDRLAEPRQEPLMTIVHPEPEHYIDPADDPMPQYDPLPGQQSLFDDKEGEPQERDAFKPEVDRFGEDFLKEWDKWMTWLISLPRRGGIVELTKQWSESRKKQTVICFRKFSQEFGKIADDLEEGVCRGEGQ